eukprot:scaffold7103_cov212-Ochromonas_danica.AAC.1
MTSEKRGQYSIPLTSFFGRFSGVDNHLCSHAVDIQQSVDGRISARGLEALTASLDFVCFFTVVPNVFVALDFMENTHFDMIIANYELHQHNALEIVKVLSSTTPIVLIAGTDEEVGRSDSTSHQNRAEVEDKALTEESCQRYASTILRRPFSPSDLLQVIVSIKREADLLYAAAKVNDDDLANVSDAIHQVLDLPQHNGVASEDIVRQLIGSDDELSQHYKTQL